MVANFQVQPAGPLTGANEVTQLNNALAGLVGSPDNAFTAAATTDIGSSASRQVNITFGATITSFGSNANLLVGALYQIRFTNAGQITFNATSMITPTGQSMQMHAGDAVLAEFIGTPGSVANWRILSWWPGNSGAGAFTPVVNFGGTPTSGFSGGGTPAGNYVVIGPMLFGEIRFAGTLTGTGAMTITGLPIPCRAGGVGSAIVNSATTLTAVTANAYGSIAGGSTTITMHQGGTTGDAPLNQANLLGGTSWQINFEYLIA